MVDEFYAPLMRKYKPKAIELGFKDYEISQDRFAGTAIDDFIMKHIYKEGREPRNLDV